MENIKICQTPEVLWFMAEIFQFVADIFFAKKIIFQGVGGTSIFQIKNLSVGRIFY